MRRKKSFMEPICTGTRSSKQTNIWVSKMYDSPWGPLFCQCFQGPFQSAVYLVLNFREEKTERSLFKLLLTDLSQQILKLVDQLYARNIAEIAYIGQQYIEIGNIVNLVLTPMMGECLGDQRGERYADYCVSKHNGFGGCLFMIGKAWMLTK